MNDWWRDDECFGDSFVQKHFFFAFAERIWAGVLKPLFQTLYLLQVCLNSYHQLACHYCPVKGSRPRWAIPVQAERWRQRKLRPQCCPLLCLMERQHFVLSPWQKSSWGLQLPAQELSLHGSRGGSLGYNCTGHFYVAVLCHYLIYYLHLIFIC